MRVRKRLEDKEKKIEEEKWKVGTVYVLGRKWKKH